MGNYNVVVSNTAGSVTSQVARLEVGLGAGYIVRWLYPDIPGIDVADLSFARDFPDRPAALEQMTGGFAGAVNLGDDYGSLIQGYLTAPQTGNYTFWIAAADAAELWLSPDENVSNSHSIAACGQAVGLNQWDANPGEQQSAPQFLRQGERYAVQVLHKAGLGPDHVEVGWRLPDLTLQRPIPAQYLSPLDNVVAEPVVRQGPSPLAVIAGQQAIFTVLAAGIEPLSYQWQFNGVNLAGQTSASLVLNNVRVGQAGAYQVVVTNKFGQATSPPATLTVNFSLAANATAGGAVKASPAQAAYAPGSQVTVTATAQPGYTFTGWSGDNTSSDNPLTLTLDHNIGLTANFRAVWNLTVILTAGGTVTRDLEQPRYLDGTAVTLTALPADGFVFTGWSGDVVSGDNPLALPMNGNKSVRANFAPVFTLKTTFTGQGSITLSPPKALYNLGDTVIVSATPAEGYAFVNWSGDNTSTSPSISVTMNGNKNLVANFKPLFSLVVTTLGQGSAVRDPEAASYVAGALVQVTARETAGWQFVEWRGALVGAQNPQTVVLDANKQVTAVFRQLFTVGTHVSGQGTILLDPNQATYLDGTLVKVTASAGLGSRFVGWQGALGGSVNPTTLVVDGNKDLTAVFSAVWTLVTTATTGGSVQRNPDASSYNDGAEVTLQALEQPGYRFKNWSGDLASTQNPLVVRMDRDKNLVANFVRLWVLGTTISGAGKLDIQPAKTRYDAGDTVTLTALPDAGNGFAGWAGASTSTNATIQLVMDADKALTALFKPLVTLATEVVGQGAVTRVPDAATYLQGTVVQVTANATTGWQFAAWSGASTETNPSIALTLDGSKTLTAIFKQLFTITATTSSGRGSVRLNPAQGPYVDGSAVTLTASIPLGYGFAGWTGDVVTNKNPVTITITTNLTIVANIVPVWNLTLTIGAGGSVLNDPAGTKFTDGTSVKLTAVPGDTFAFKGWSGDLSGNGNPATLLMNGNKSVGATFAPAVSLTTSAVGEGTLSVDPLKDRYAQGDMVTVSAAPAAGWAFVGWSGATNATNALITLTLDTTKSLTATFKRLVSLAVNVVGQGTATRVPEAVSYVLGTTVTLTARAASGWEFVEWQGALTGAQNPLSLPMTADAQLTALFQQLFPVARAANGPGSVQVSPDQPVYREGTTLTVTAVPDLGQRFTGWSGDLSGTNNPTSLVVDGPKNIVGNFVRGWVLTTSVAAAGGKVTRDPDLAEYGDGVGVRVTALPDAGFAFLNWGGDASGTNNPLAVVMTTNKSVQASFTRAWPLTVKTSTGGSVARDPDLSAYPDGSQVSLTARPDAGFVFTGWGTDASGNANPLVLTMNAAKTVTANFKAGESLPPVVHLASPAVGTVVDERVVLSGTATDNTAVARARWEWDGRVQGPVTVDANGQFRVEGIRLHQGENRLRVVAVDPSDNEGAAEAVLTWTPVRTLAVLDAPAQQEGKKLTLPVQFNSQGDVGGMSFVLHYDAAYLRDPWLVWSAAAGASANQVNTNTAGEVRATFALGATALPGGTQLVAAVTFRARSVPETLGTPVTPEVLDVSQAAPGSPTFPFGTDAQGGNAPILKRRYAGDDNGNNRLDIGDATVMQRLVTRLDPVRDWDVTGNDLNQNGQLDSGDVNQVLRVVVGLDPQPGGGMLIADFGSPNGEDVGSGRAGSPLPAAEPGLSGAQRSARPTRDHIALHGGGPGPGDTNEAALLLPGAAQTKPGDLVKFQVVLTNIQGALAGASFRLDYPTNALRLVDDTSRAAGALVPPGAATLWNVAPAQNDYAQQSGRLSFAASSATAWPLANGVLAEVILQVQPGVTAQAEWAVRLSGLEITADGFENRLLPDVTAVVRPAGVARPAIDVGQCGMTPEGFQVAFRGESGATYVVEWSENLENWGTLRSVVGAPGLVTVVDGAALASPRLYYRVRTAP